MNLGNVLIVDDDPIYWETYQERLEREGYHAEIVPTREAALARLRTPPEWDVILLDVKLRGPNAPDDGLEVLVEVQALAPLAQIIMVSGLAEEYTVETAFLRGAHDYLEKGGRLLWALLRAKVRGAVERSRERRLRGMVQEDREHLLQQIYQDVLQERSARRKGALLEELLVVLFKTIPEFEDVIPQARSAAEEMDLVVVNQSQDPLWSKGSEHFLVECKNWSSKTERKELDAFTMKLLRRGERCRTGFFIAVGGFSRGFQRTASAPPVRDELVVSIGPEDLERLVQAADGAARNEELKRLYSQSALHLRSPASV